MAAHLFPTLRRGANDPDVTLLTYGGMVPVVEIAAKHLVDAEELAVEVVVPALLAPLPVSTLIGHLKTRKRVVIVEESQHHYGVAAEIAACLLESGYRGKVLRIGAPPIPIASARSLERQILPDETRIFEQVLDMI